VPRGVLKRILWAEDLTKDNTGLTFTIAFNYGGRAEIIDAVKQLVEDGVKPDKIDEKAIRARMYDPSMPDPELMIRTSGECRISNYLLWQLAYSELVFTEVLWPDFRKQHLADAIREFQARERRFGAVSDS
jgi:undecaprenyl diphosphate synthase